MSKYQITGIIYIHINMNEWVKRYTWEFAQKAQRGHSARWTHAYITQLHILSTQPANKVVEHSNGKKALSQAFGSTGV